MAQPSLGPPTPLRQTRQGRCISCHHSQGTGQAPCPHTGRLSTASTIRYGTIHNSEHVEMENEDKEHE